MTAKPAPPAEPYVRGDYSCNLTGPHDPHLWIDATNRRPVSCPGTPDPDASDCPSCHTTAGRPHTEYCRAPRCAHFAEHGEGVVWPLAVSLDHFDNCLTPEKRLQRWGFIREDGEQSRRCLEQDHDGRLAWLEEELRRMTQTATEESP